MISGCCRGLHGKLNGRHVGLSPTQCDDTGAQNGDAASWLVWLRRRGDGCRAGLDDDDGLQWCMNVQHTTYLRVEQLGVFVSVRRRAVVQLRAQNVTAKRCGVKFPNRSVAVGHHYWRCRRDAKAAANQMVVGEADSVPATLTLASCFLYSLAGKSIKFRGYPMSIIVTQSLS